MRRFVTDKNTYKVPTSRTFTDEGFLKAPARVARTGIQQYLASELGLKDRNPNDIVNVYRPPEEVFNTKSLSTYQHKEITDDHPAEMVNAENVKKLSLGQVTSEGVEDGDYVQIDILVKDKVGVQKVKEGKTELSAGYYADYIREPGVTDSGQEYEFVQRNIVINHVALVDKARAGAGAKIFDKKTGGRTMAILTLDSGRSVEVEDNTAPLIQDTIERLTKRADDAESESKKKDEDLQKEKAKSDNLKDENEKLKEKSNDSAINAMVADTLAVHAVAKQLVPKIEIGDKSIDQIKLEVCKTLHPKRDFSDRDPTYINATFDMDKEKMEDEDEEEEKKKKSSADSLKNFAQDMSSTNQKTVDARSIRQSQVNDAWKRG